MTNQVERGRKGSGQMIDRLGADCRLDSPSDGPQDDLRRPEERSRPIRVCLVTETYFPQVNGVSRTLSQLVRHLTNRGDEVLLVHPDYKDGSDDPWRVPVRAIRPFFYRELYLPVPPFRAVYQRIERFRPDLIHIATEATLGLRVLQHTQRRKIPVVSSFHTNFDQYTEHYGLGCARGLIWRYLRWFHNRTRETYVPSSVTLEDLESRGFERLFLWPRGVDAQLFRPDRPGRESVRQACGFQPDEVVVGHVGRLAAEKNIDYLAASLTKLLALNPNVRVLVVGDGPARGQLEVALGPRAVFVGFRTGDDLADHYAAADLFAFASRTETFGNVILEALASGLPVVAVRSGGPAGIVHDGQTGYLIDPDASSDQHAEALLRLASNEVLRQTMGRQGREFALSQSWDSVMSLIRSRYQAIIGPGAAKAATPLADG